MKRFYFIAFLLIANLSFGDTWETWTGGVWNSIIWMKNGIPVITSPPKDISGNTVIINHPVTAGGALTYGSSSGTLTLNSTLAATSVITSGFGNFVINGNSPLTLSGIMTLAGGGSTFDISAPLNVGGLMTISNGGVVNANSASTLSGGLLINGGAGVTFQSIMNTTTIDVSNGISLTLNGASSATGAITLTGSAKLKGTGTLSFVSKPSITGGAKIIGSGDETNCSITSTASLPNTSPLDLSQCNVTPLPIVLKDFNVEHKELGFEFKWATLQEIDNDFFTIEYSFDAKEFVDFAKIKGAGTSYQTLDYDYVDSKLNFERDVDVVYFKLKQTDFDGTYDYSHIVPVSLNKNIELSAFHFYPNPANNFVVLRLEDWFENAGDLELTFVNMSGASFTKTVDVKSKETKIDVSEIPTGVYMVVSGGLVNPSKLLIE